MKKCVSQLLALALGMATSASADELDILIHKLRGSTPTASSRKVLESPSVAPQRHTDLANKQLGDTTPMKIVEPAPVEQQCQTAITDVAAPYPPATLAPAPVTPPPTAHPPDSKLPPTARPPAAVAPPVAALTKMPYDNTTSVKNPSLASVGKNVALEAVPQKLEAEENETIFPAGSKASRCADSRLKIVVPKAGTHIFPAGSRAFQLQDRTLKIVPPKPPTPASETLYQN